MVTFTSHILSGLGFPPSAFLIVVLAHYHLELCNLNSSAIVHLSVFITMCEYWLGIAPDLELFRYFHYPPKYSRFSSPVRSIGFKFRHANEYIRTAVKTSSKKAREYWFIVHLPEATPAQKEMLVPQILDPTKEEPILFSSRLAMVRRITELRNLGLCHEIVAEEFIRRGVQPLGERDRPMYETPVVDMSELLIVFLNFLFLYLLIHL